MAESDEQAPLKALVEALTGLPFEGLARMGARFRERRRRHREGTRWIVVSDLPVDSRARRTRRWPGWCVRGWLTDGERAIAVLEVAARKG